MRTISPEQFKKQYGEESLVGFEAPIKKPNYFQRVGQSFKETFTGLKSNLETQAETIAGEELEQEPSRIKQATALGRGGLRAVGAFAKTAFTPLMEAPGIKPATEFIGEKLAGAAPLQKFNEWAGRHPEAAKDIMDTLDIAALFGGKPVAKTFVKGVEKGTVATIKATEQTAKAGIQTGKELVAKGKVALAPPAPTAKEAIGQVLQGQTKDIKAGVRGLKEVNTTGIKTYSELSNKVNETIKNLSVKVDEILDNITPVKLKELSLSGTTVAGKKVVVDYVSRGLNHLKEMYKAIGDDIAGKNIDELINKAKSIGLTRKEVNDIARTYGIEFGEKAFSKTGEALTSINAKMFENTRKALKVVARQGLKGSKAEVIDKSISALYKVKDLVKKNTEAVNKLTQKIQERGLLEKMGYKVAKAVDVLTGRSLRGVIGGLLPRGVGYKVMNALDLEEVLSRNLEIIQKALKAKDSDLIKMLKISSPK